MCWSGGNPKMRQSRASPLSPGERPAGRPQTRSVEPGSICSRPSRPVSELPSERGFPSSYALPSLREGGAAAAAPPLRVQRGKNALGLALLKSPHGRSRLQPHLGSGRPGCVCWLRTPGAHDRRKRETVLTPLDECGPRVSELEHAAVGDIDEERQAIRVRRATGPLVRTCSLGACPRACLADATLVICRDVLSCPAHL
jgi:hypothetical protein